MFAGVFINQIHYTNKNFFTNLTTACGIYYVLLGKAKIFETSSGLLVKHNTIKCRSLVYQVVYEPELKKYKECGS